MKKFLLVFCTTLLFWSGLAGAQTYRFDYEVFTVTDYVSREDKDKGVYQKQNKSALYSSESPHIRMFFIEGAHLDYEAVLVDEKYRMVHLFNIIRQQDESVKELKHLRSEQIHPYIKARIKAFYRKGDDQEHIVTIERNKKQYLTVIVELEEIADDLLHVMQIEEEDMVQDMVLNELKKNISPGSKYFPRKYTYQYKDNKPVIKNNTINKIDFEVKIPETNSLKKNAKPKK